MTGKVIAHLLSADGAIPNHPRWPLLVYPGAIALSGADPVFGADGPLFEHWR